MFSFRWVDVAWPHKGCRIDFTNPQVRNYRVRAFSEEPVGEALAPQGRGPFTRTGNFLAGSHVVTVEQMPPVAFWSP